MGKVIMAEHACPGTPGGWSPVSASSGRSDAVVDIPRCSHTIFSVLNPMGTLIMNMYPQARIWLDDGFETSEDIIIAGKYLPWTHHKERGGDSRNYPTHSSKIMDVKVRQSSLDYFFNMFNPLLGDHFAICYVPSSDPNKTVTGIRLLAERLASVGGRVDATSCLVRTKEVPKLATGGNRSIEVHLDSIAVKKAHLLAQRKVLVMDDVTTTGGSLTACRQLLNQAGVTFIRLAALGETSYD